jgi:methyl-accepting chemotaxis protein
MSFGIRAKLLAGFGAVLVLLAGVGFIGWKNTTDFAADFRDLYQDELVTSANLSRVQRGLYELRMASVNYVTSNTAARDKIKSDDANWLKLIDDNLTAYASSPLEPEEQQALQEWRASYPTYLQTRQQVFALFDEDRAAEANALRTGAARDASTRAVADLDKLISLQEQAGAETNARVSAAADMSVKLLVAIILGALVAGVGLALFLARGFARTAGQVAGAINQIAHDDLPSLVRVAQALAEGDLTQRVVVTAQRVRVASRDELGVMATDFNRMVDGLQKAGQAFETMGANLRHLVGQVQASATALADTSNELGSSANQTGSVVQQVAQAVQNVAIGAQDTSRSAQDTNVAVAQLGKAIDGIANGAGEQARQVQAASATATQMAAGVEQVAANASQVAAASEQTRAAAEQGSQAVRETTATMTAIREVVRQAASKVEELGKLGEKIGAVVETIDDIAEQTNLLALNAAIEAARAGEHGRGFAVVADEVRKLAERSGRETKQIGELIQQVQLGTRDAVSAMSQGSATVEQGTDKAAQAGAALEEIRRVIDLTVAQVTEIASSTHQMAVGARQVTDAMQSISAVVEENTASTEEMSAQSGQVAEAISSIAAVAEEQSAAVEEVSASAGEMSAQVEEMSAQAQELAATAEQLRTLVARFKLDEDDAPAAGTTIVPLRLAA